MPKGYKIKRYGKIYRGSKRSPSTEILRWVIGAAAVLGIIFVGWNAYGPVRDYLTGALAASAAKRPVEAAPTESVPTPEPIPEPAAEAPTGDLRAVYAPIELLRDPQRLDALLATLSGTPINALLFDLKDENGAVLYRSALETVAQIGAQADAAYDLEALCQKLSDRGLLPIGRLHCFKDPKAASRIKHAGVTYLDTEMLWLDNAENAGGKPWLNPYAAPAKDYLKALAAESAQLGVGRLLLDSYSFPTGYGLEVANFKGGAVPKAEALTAFVGDLATAGAQSRGVSLYVSGTAALGLTDASFGGVNPLSLYEDLTLGVLPAQFGERFSAANLTLQTPVLQPGETVKALLGAVSPSLSDKRMTGMVQAYTAENLTNNKPYTREDINAQLTALSEGGVTNYILYSPSGVYPQ